MNNRNRADDVHYIFSQTDYDYHDLPKDFRDALSKLEKAKCLEEAKTAWQKLNKQGVSCAYHGAGKDRLYMWINSQATSSVGDSAGWYLTVENGGVWTNKLNGKRELGMTAALEALEQSAAEYYTTAATLTKNTKVERHIMPNPPEYAWVSGQPLYGFERVWPYEAAHNDDLWSRVRRLIHACGLKPGRDSEAFGLLDIEQPFLESDDGRLALVVELVDGSTYAVEHTVH